MDRTAPTDFYTDPQSCALASPDPETRGRQRRRDPLSPFSLPRHHHASRESSTLRGRCRRRSASRLSLVTALSSATAAHSPEPEKRRLLVVVRSEDVRRRRGQSPSRSRSPGGSGRAGGAEVLLLSPVLVVGQRRRQRTQSRSRRHRLEGAFASVALAGRPTLGFEGWVAEDAGVSGKD